ncbi:methyl-accepting chemotaxis protein [Brassicibacter mesophilus]|uniref:methyl-accepting chemotaxis protein n=1 Tax=Brassicibacter mesophilus TaxID=745119 RepID=UPI003D1E0AA9
MGIFKGKSKKITFSKLKFKKLKNEKNRGSNNSTKKSSKKLNLSFKKNASTKKLNVQSRIKNQIAIIVLLLTIIPILFTGFLNFYFEGKQSSDHIKEMNLNMAKSIAKQVDMYIDGSFDVLQSLSTTHDFTNMDIQKARTILISTTTNLEYINSIQIYDTKGNQLISTKNMRAGINARSEEWFTKASKGEKYVSDSYMDDRIPAVIVSMPIKNALNQTKGVIAANISLKDITSLATENKIGKTGIAYIVDKQGITIAHPDFNNKVVTQFNAKENKIKGAIGALEGKTNIDTYANDSNTIVVGAFTPVSSTGWGVIIEQNQNEINAGAVTNLIRTLVIIVLAILVTIILTSFTAKKFSAPIENLALIADEIAKGDLTKRVKVTSTNEIGYLENAFNKMLDSLYKVISSVNQAVNNFKSNVENLNESAGLTVEASVEISKIVEQVASGTDKQLKSVEDAIGIVESITNNVKNVDENAQSILMATSEASMIAKEGSKDIEQTKVTMDSIADKVNQSANQIDSLTEHTNQIGKIITFIDNISKQTNLLALNAAIEAARAGEYGRGFTVVAEEIRALAEQTLEASRNIVNIINEIQTEVKLVSKSMEEGIAEVNKGNQVIDKTTKSFSNIVDETDKVFKGVEDFAVIVEELSENMKVIESSISQVSAISQETASGTQTVLASTEEQQSAIHQINQSAEELNEMAEKLEDMIKEFKID